MYRWIDHTGELELEVTGRTREDVFSEGARALRELLAEPEEASGGELSRELELEAGDRAGLFAAWLGELAFLAEDEGLVFDAVELLELGESRLRAVVRGHAGAPPHLVKAVTYHRLEMEPDDRWGWRGHAVLDV